jgi:WhiB family redox-sensing transcriptional regulator
MSAVAASPTATGARDALDCLRSLAAALDSQPAPCQQVDPDLFFDGTAAEAAAVCASCPAVLECRGYADAVDARWGVWGGRERDRSGRWIT